MCDSYVDGGDPKPLNRPNDVVVHPKTGAVYFTDPVHGMKDEDFATYSSYGEMWVFRFDRDANHAVPVVKDFQRPNGLCFTPDVSKLYICDDAKNHVRLFDVQQDGSLEGGDVFCDIDSGVPDGMRVDTRRPALQHGGRRCACLHARRPPDRQDSVPRKPRELSLRRPRHEDTVHDGQDELVLDRPAGSGDLRPSTGNLTSFEKNLKLRVILLCWPRVTSGLTCLAIRWT